MFLESLSPKRRGLYFFLKLFKDHRGLNSIAAAQARALCRGGRDRVTDYTRPYDGVNEVIDTLKAKGIKIGIVSNKLQSPLEDIVFNFWGNKIDAVVGITDALPSKPYPDMVYACLKKMDTSLADAIYIGDSLVDLQTATNAGAKFIACSWGFATREALLNAGATEIIDHPSEVLKYLD